MLRVFAESNIPLVIDQPEDDLDNAFTFSAVVKALRSIKERRQVTLVTHNANIAVLGDAELLCPMRRNGEGEMKSQSNMSRSHLRLGQAGQFVELPNFCYHEKAGCVHLLKR